jgi:acyl carrier protein
MEPIVQEIKAAVRRYIEDNFIMGAGGVALADGDSFLEHHVLDSTGFLELISHLEEAYGIKVLDDEMVPENLDSLDSVAAFVARKHSA